MATALCFEALRGLRRLDPATSALGGAVSGLLEACGIQATIVHAIAPGAWFGCGDAIRFRMLDSRPLDETRIGDAVRILDDAEPLLERLEQGLGISLEPAGILEGDPDRSVVLLVRSEALAAELALPVDHPAAQRWHAEAQALDPAPAATPLVLRILVDGPRLPMAEAGSLEPGDLVLLSTRTAATLEAGPIGSITGLLDFLSGAFTLQPQGTTMAADGPGSATSRDFAVPLTLRLPERMTSAASLADLRPGTALPLGPLTDGMPVELLVAGRALARGELVQLGDRFAVLIEERVGIDDRPAPSIEEAEPVAAAEARA
jgi:flagellar motor switch/type III secretory pathway protein FliN